MITITKILGNLKRDSDLDQKHKELLEKNFVENVMIRRSESEKIRMRKTSDKGTDIGFILSPGTRLKDKDVVFLDNDKIIIIRLLTELVAIISFKYQTFCNDQDHNYFYLINVAIKVGHTIGNLHRPLKLEQNKIIFPIQTLDEINLFQKLLVDVKDHIQITSNEMIFEPDQGFDIHEH